MSLWAYNLELLKPNDSHYVAVGFALPYYLHLPNGNYETLIDVWGKQVIVQVILERQQHRRNHTDAFANIEDAGKYLDPHGEHYFTTAQVYIPVGASNEQDNQNEHLLSEQVRRNHPGYAELARTAVNRLAQIYRFQTAECHISSIAGRDVWYDYSFAFFFLPPGGKKSHYRATVTPIHDIRHALRREAVIPASVISELRNLIASDFQVPLTDELLLNAHEHLARGNYRLAILEAETAFEAAVIAFLHNHYRASPNDIRRVEDSRSFTQLINSCRDAIRATASEPFEPAQRSPYRLASPLYQEWDDNVWQVRGDLVHGRKRSASEEEAIRALEVIETALEKIIGRTPIRPWRF